MEDRAKNVLPEQRLKDVKEQTNTQLPDQKEE